MKSIDQLLQTPYWIIDILPKQVPKGSPGQYFAVERYYLKRQMAAVKQKHINVILKLNCYFDITLDDETEVNPAPEKIADAMRSRHVNIRVGESLLTSEADDTYMTVYNADERLLSLMRSLAAAEGLFIWKGKETKR